MCPARSLQNELACRDVTPVKFDTVTSHIRDTGRCRLRLRVFQTNSHRNRAYGISIASRRRIFLSRAKLEYPGKAATKRGAGICSFGTRSYDALRPSTKCKTSEMIANTSNR